MINERVKELALAAGFKLKTQPDGTEDLNPYVYEFARALLADPLSPQDQRGVAERRQFYEGQMANPGTHSALAFELAFLRAKTDAAAISEEEGRMLGFIQSMAAKSYSGVSVQHDSKGDAEERGYRVMWHHRIGQHHKDFRTALREAMVESGY